MADTSIYGLTTDQATQLYNQLKNTYSQNFAKSGALGQAGYVNPIDTGIVPYTPDYNKTMPYSFLLPGISLGGSVTSVEGVAGSPNQISVQDPSKYISFTDLERALGLNASNATTANTVPNAAGTDVNAFYKQYYSLSADPTGYATTNLLTNPRPDVNGNINYAQGTTSNTQPTTSPQGNVYGNPAQGYQQLPGTTPISLPVTPSMTTGQMTSNPVSASDLQNLLTQNRNLYLSSIAKSQPEVDLETQLTKLRDAANKTNLNIENRTIPEAFNIGESSRVTKLFQAEEQNLLTRLGLAQEARKITSDTAKAGMDFALQDIQLQQKAQEIINTQNEQILDRAQQLSTASRQTLATMLDQFKGLTIDKLDPAAQAQLATLASQAGIPYDMIVKGMETVKNQITLDNGIKLAKEASSTGASDQLYSGLSSATASAVKAKVQQFKTEPIASNFSTVQEGYNFASSLSNTTTNPADDQALIYSLAKVLDPNSVVREGEYATAQKYSQSWVNSFGKSITQAINGTGFLSETARQNIKQTIAQKYAAAQTSYNNLYNQYTSGINNLTGRSDGSKFLIDYTTPTSTTTKPSLSTPLNIGSTGTTSSGVKFTIESIK